MMRIRVLMLSTLLGASLMSKVLAQEFEPGQEWSYEARAEDLNSTLVIGALEQHPELGEIVHISIRNVRAGGRTTNIGHIPIALAALRESVRELISESASTEGIDAGIAAWREAKGGVFTISVAEAVAYVEQAVTSEFGNR